MVGGGGSYTPSTTTVAERLEAAREASNEKDYDIEVNGLLNEALREFYDRDAAADRQRLDAIAEVLGE